MALSEISNKIIALLHSMPINFLGVAASTLEDLLAHAESPRGQFVNHRQAALQRYMTQEGQEASEQTKSLWAMRHTENGFVVRVYDNSGVPMSGLDAQGKQEREAFFKRSVEVWTGTKDILARLENMLIGPYALGVFVIFQESYTKIDTFLWQVTKYPSRTCTSLHGSLASCLSLARPILLQVHRRHLKRQIHLGTCILGSNSWKRP
jgi:hypothetical protein